ncbi:1-phosphatidylinositol 4,5-bisphosphate phosphodiesterase beta-2-like [Phaenicophaeus curvirostris]|uniref:1-phosphatidylinositol 4,5-bisphosphate phosphodiesterase beta-2-like n=1 Tax=Phaenicophaeus curvirostris TaxID=33595 RepID=UPI0037F0B2BD
MDFLLPFAMTHFEKKKTLQDLKYCADLRLSAAQSLKLCSPRQSSAPDVEGCISLRFVINLSALSSLRSNIKDIKKKLEAKRVDRVQAVMRSTSDKAAQERLKKEINNSHIQEVVQTIKLVTEKTARCQQKLEEKQAENLRAIKEKEGQLQQDALAEYKEKLKRLSVEVQEMVKSYARGGFPGEPETRKEAAQSVPEGEQGPTERLEEKILVAEVSRLPFATPGPPGAKTDVEIEESRF